MSLVEGVLEILYAVRYLQQPLEFGLAELFDLQDTVQTAVEKAIAVPYLLAGSFVSQTQESDSYQCFINVYD